MSKRFRPHCFLKENVSVHLISRLSLLNVGCPIDLSPEAWMAETPSPPGIKASLYYKYTTACTFQDLRPRWLPSTDKMSHSALSHHCNGLSFVENRIGSCIWTKGKKVSHSRTTPLICLRTVFKKCQGDAAEEAGMGRLPGWRWLRAPCLPLFCQASSRRFLSAPCPCWSWGLLCCL